MSGFVYLWFDRCKKLFYIGSHWGAEDDGYVCSSPWMKRAYNRRPADFKRRILEHVDSSRVELLEAEQRWLDMIKPNEIKARYYNLVLSTKCGWWTDDKKRLTVGQKISKTKTGIPRTAKEKAKISEATRAGMAKMPKAKKTRRKPSPETVAKRIASRAGYRHSEATKLKMSQTKLSKKG